MIEEEEPEEKTVKRSAEGDKLGNTFASVPVIEEPIPEPMMDSYVHSLRNGYLGIGIGSG